MTHSCFNTQLGFLIHPTFNVGVASFKGVFSITKLNFMHLVLPPVLLLVFILSSSRVLLASFDPVM